MPREEGRKLPLWKQSLVLGQMGAFTEDIDYRWFEDSGVFLLVNAYGTTLMWRFGTTVQGDPTPCSEPPVDIGFKLRPYPKTQLSHQCQW